jgi:nucleoside-diphosphate-sugar epimerase
MEPESVRSELPTVLVTGASGLVGRYFIEAVKERFTVYAVARRNQSEAKVPAHPNIRWLRCDIGDEQMITRLCASVAAKTTVDYIFHFAGYYDFSFREDPEYQRTNVDGTRYLLENAERLKPKRFIFSSSLAVTDFFTPGLVIDEESPPDGDYAYARSKKEAEETVRAFSGKFPCTVARLAAIYSDWCEYAPLYILLDTWLSGGPLSRIIAGKGETAIPYLHVQDLNAFWLKIIEKSDDLPDFDILAASPSGCVSHNELYAAATQCYDRSCKAVHFPIWLATVGVAAKRFLGLLIGKPPFERPWMMRYIDKSMQIDASFTHKLLGWSLKPRFHVMRRLLFLVENMKRDPMAWESKNLAMTKRTHVERPGLKIYSAMMEVREEIIRGYVAYLTAPENWNLFPSYQRLEPHELQMRAEFLYQMLEASIRLGDRQSILSYANYLARRRFMEGFSQEEVFGALEYVAHGITDALKQYPGLEDLQDTIYNEITIALQLIQDEIEDTYDNLAAQES